MLIRNGDYFKRREVKKGKAIPSDFIMETFDPVTGKRVGWVPIIKNASENKYHMEAFKSDLKDGTYEIVGPKFQKNLEKFSKHTLIKHSDVERYNDAPRDLELLRKWLEKKDIEGLVFHHPDGRMGKIKKRDFGLNRDPESG